MLLSLSILMLVENGQSVGFWFPDKKKRSETRIFDKEKKNKQRKEVSKCCDC